MSDDTATHITDAREYRTYLPSCDCREGVIMKDGILYCRWCRSPYHEAAFIQYKPEHFKPGGDVVENVITARRPQ